MLRFNTVPISTSRSYQRIQKVAYVKLRERCKVRRSLPVSCIRRFGYLTGFAEKYRLGELLGAGSFGTVHVGINIATGERFAVKTIPKRYMGGHLDPTLVRRVQHEVDIYMLLGASLNIAPVYEVFEDDNCVDLVMQLCTGGELWQQLRRRAYCEHDAARIAREVLMTVAQCHAKHVIIRDVKAENFLFLDNTPGSPLKMIDFGLADFCDPQQELTNRVGSPVYVAPEVLKMKYGQAADLWSAGILIYQLLTGHLPFKGEFNMAVDDLFKSRDSFQMKDLFRAILYADLDFDTYPWNEVSAEALDLVQSLLERDASKRLTAEQALQHPWFANLDAHTSAALDPSVVQRLQRFGTYSKLKQAALKELALLVTKEHGTGTPVAASSRRWLASLHSTPVPSAQEEDVMDLRFGTPLVSSRRQLFNQTAAASRLSNGSNIESNGSNLQRSGSNGSDSGSTWSNGSSKANGSNMESGRSSTPNTEFSGSNRSNMDSAGSNGSNIKYNGSNIEYNRSNGSNAKYNWSNGSTIESNGSTGFNTTGSTGSNGSNTQPSMLNGSRMEPSKSNGASPHSASKLFSSSVGPVTHSTAESASSVGAELKGAGTVNQSVQRPTSSILSPAGLSMNVSTSIDQSTADQAFVDRSMGDQSTATQSRVDQSTVDQSTQEDAASTSSGLMVQYDEVLTQLQQQGFELSPSEIRQLLNQFQLSKAGMLDYYGLVAALLEWKNVRSSPEWNHWVQQVFQTFDTDGTGQLETTDLTHVLCGEECPVEDTVPALMRGLHMDPLGSISFEDFNELLSPEEGDRLDLYESRVPHGEGDVVRETEQQGANGKMLKREPDVEGGVVRESEEQGANGRMLNESTRP